MIEEDYRAGSDILAVVTVFVPINAPAIDLNFAIEPGDSHPATLAARYASGGSVQRCANSPLGGHVIADADLLIVDHEWVNGSHPGTGQLSSDGKGAFSGIRVTAGQIGDDAQDITVEYEVAFAVVCDDDTVEVDEQLTLRAWLADLSGTTRPRTSRAVASGGAVQALLLEDDDALSPPTNLTLSSSSTSLTASWDEPVGTGSVSPDGYELQHREVGTGDAGWTSTTVSGRTTLTKTVTGLTLGSTYRVRVRSTQGTGANRHVSSWSAEARATLGSANNAPVAGVLPDVTLQVGRQAVVQLGEAFTDPDDDALIYTVTSSATATVTAATPVGSTVTLTGVAAGQATVTVTATDPGGLSAGTSFLATVTAAPANNAPVAGVLPDVTLQVGRQAVVQLGEAFTDPDDDALIYTVTSSATATVTAATPVGSTVTLTGVAAGQATVTVTATDPGGLSAGTSFLATVTAAPANNAPVAGVLPDVTLQVGRQAVVQLGEAFTDPDNDALTYTVASSVTAAVTAATPVGATVTLTGVAAGQATITVTATDSGGLSASTSFLATVTAAPANNAPVVSGELSDVTLQVGRQAVVQLGAAFTDPDNDALTYTVASSVTAAVTAATPVGATVTLTGVAAGQATITVTATDSGGLSASTSFLATVTAAPANNAPVVSGELSDVTLQVGRQAVVQLGAAFTDPDNDALTYTVASSVTAAVTAATPVGATVTLTGVAAGQATITVTATDSGGLSASTSFLATVTAAPANNAPVVSGLLAEVTVQVGGSVVVQVGVVFTDPDGDTLSYTASSSDETKVATPRVAGASVSLTGLAAGQSTITVTASDGRGGTASTSFLATVRAPENRPPVLVGGDPEPVRVVVDGSVKLSLVFTDPDGDTITYTATSARSGVATVSHSSTSTGVDVTVTGVSVGTTSITLVATDGTASLAVTLSVEVLPPPRAVPGAPVDVVAQASDRSIVLTWKPGTPPGERFRVRWREVVGNEEGSGRTDGVWVDAGPRTGTTFTLSNLKEATTYRLEVRAEFNVTLPDPSAPCYPLCSSWVGAEATTGRGEPPNLPPEVASQLPDISVTVGRTVRVNISAAFTDPEGDPLFAAASIDLPDIASLSASGVVIAVTGLAIGAATVTVSVTDRKDGPGRPVMQSFAVTVDEVPNTPPELVGSIADVVVGVGRAVHVLAEFTDAEGDDLAITVVSGRPDVASVTRSFAGGTVDITVTGVSPGDAAVSITAHDGRESTHASFNVTVESIISPPTNLAWRAESATSGTLSWDPPRVGRDEITHYELRYIGGSAGTSTAETPGVPHVRLADLEPGCRYSAVVRGVARGGGPVVDGGLAAAAVEGEWSDPLGFAIPPAGACDAKPSVIGGSLRGGLTFPPGGALAFSVEPRPPSAFELEVRLAVGPDFVLSSGGGAPSAALSIVIPAGSLGVDVELREKVPYFRYSENLRAVVDASFIGPAESGATLDGKFWPLAAVRSNRLTRSAVGFAHDGNGMARAALGEWARGLRPRRPAARSGGRGPRGRFARPDHALDPARPDAPRVRRLPRAAPTGRSPVRPGGVAADPGRDAEGRVPDPPRARRRRSPGVSARDLR